MKKELFGLLSALLLWSFSASAAGSGGGTAAGRPAAAKAAALKASRKAPGPRRQQVINGPSGGVYAGGNWGWGWDYDRYDRALDRKYAELIWHDQQDLDAVLRYASERNRYVLLLLTVPGEPAGLQLEQEVFTDPDLIVTIQRYVIPVRIYAPEGWQQGSTPSGKRFREILNWGGVTWLPALLYLDPQGRIIERGMGYRGNASQIIRALKKTLRR